MKKNILFGLLFICCCKGKVEKSDIIEKFLSRQIVNETIVIIPQTGCVSCVESAFLLLKDAIDNDLEIKFVITNISDKKLIRNFIPKYYLSNPNVFMDYDNILPYNGFYSKYPEVLFFGIGKIDSTWILSTGNKYDIVKLKQLYD